MTAQWTTPEAASMSLSFGAALATIRHSRHRRVSQARLSELADCDHSYISRLESGARTPSREAVERIADALSASVQERDILRDAAGYRISSQVASAEPEIAALALALNRASAATYTSIMQLIRAALELAKLAECGR